MASGRSESVIGSSTQADSSATSGSMPPLPLDVIIPTQGEQQAPLTQTPTQLGRVEGTIDTQVLKRKPSRPPSNAWLYFTRENEGTIVRGMTDWNGQTLLKGEFIQMRCTAHILNLIVSDGLKIIDGSIIKYYEVEYPIPSVSSSVSSSHYTQNSTSSQTLDESDDDVDWDDAFNLKMKQKQVDVKKRKSTKYHVLSRMARDILAIPVSTVSSESAFSTGGRVLDSFRSCLNSNTVEALICTQNWIRKPKVIDLRQQMDEVQRLEEEIAGICLTSGGEVNIDGMIT
ncbi:hypothetical protein TSUD_396910 [Trifolium subterraneum]|uniref:HAT C-terminal dimerisation domain-containing protein n=1 Tax=Trifolium subterraneum TaxID=3900 RepID=A0A2Z6NTQ6_TRISU|nr:hypothetical protein TSUD_396910 [Trifolium subterraneum]